MRKDHSRDIDVPLLSSTWLRLQKQPRVQQFLLAGSNELPA